MLHVALAVFAALVAVAFAMSTFERWLAKRKRHELAWTLALGFFAIAAFALAGGAALGWNEVSFRVFFLFGAIVNVPFLAMGTVYLLGGQERGDRWMAFVALLCAFGAGVVVTAPLRAAIPADELVQGSDVFGPLPRILAAVCSGVAALVIFAGAAMSAFRYRRGRMLWANVLIAAGTVILSSSGLLNSVLGEMDAFAVTLAAGISVVFAGFLVASGASPSPARLASVPDVDARTAPSAAPAARSAAPAATVSRPSQAAARRRT